MYTVKIKGGKKNDVERFVKNWDRGSRCST